MKDKKKEAPKKKEAQRHKDNPFLDNLVVNMRSKKIKVSKMGKDNNVLVNEDTGEVNGTYVGTYKRVDEEQFLKLFTANIALTFELNSAGIKAFNVICWLMQNKAIERDLITIDKFVLEDFNEEHKKSLSRSVLYRGIDCLIENQIIARERRDGNYFINPSFIFNGDRIVFSTIIEKIKKENKNKNKEKGE